MDYNTNYNYELINYIRKCFILCDETQVCQKVLQEENVDSNSQQKQTKAKKSNDEDDNSTLLDLFSDDDLLFYETALLQNSEIYDVLKRQVETEKQNKLKLEQESTISRKSDHHENETTINSIKDTTTIDSTDNINTNFHIKTINRRHDEEDSSQIHRRLRSETKARINDVKNACSYICEF